MNINRLAFALGLLAMSALPAWAFHADPSLGPQVPCSAFRQNADGSWSPLQQITMRGPNGEMQIGPGVAFRPGVAFMGVDLGAELQSHCTLTR